MNQKFSVSLFQSLLIMVIFIAMQIAITILIEFLSGNKIIELIGDSGIKSCIQVGLNQGVIFTLVVILRKKYGLQLRANIGIRSIELKIVMLLLFLAVAYQSLGSELENVAAEIFGMDKTYHELINGVVLLPGMTGWLTAFILIAVLPAINEEFLFRHILQQGLMRRYSDTKGIIITSALFAAVHFNLNYILPIFIFSLILGFIYARYKNLLYCIILHFFNNLSVLLLIRSDSFGLQGFNSTHMVEHVDIRIIIGSIIGFLLAVYLLVIRTRLQRKAEQ